MCTGLCAEKGGNVYIFQPMQVHQLSYLTQVVVAVATAIAVLDVFFILVAVPESLPAQQQKKDGSKPAARGLTLEQVDVLIDF